MAGHSRASTRCGVPCANGADDVHVHQRGITFVEGAVHVGCRVQVVVMTPLAGDPVLLKMLDVLSVRAGPVRDQGVQGRRVDRIVTARTA